MKIWVDGARPAPEGYVWCQTVNEAKDTILVLELHATVHESNRVELIDLDYDNGDYIKLMDWLVERGTLYPLAFHSQNCAGMEYMKRMYKRYWLKESL